MTPAARQQAWQRREDQAQMREHQHATRMLEQLRALEAQWKATRELMLRESHDHVYLPGSQLPIDLELAITYWSARVTFAQPKNL